MNALLLEIGVINNDHGMWGKVAILDTPCRPNRYYAGYVQRNGENYLPLHNDTHLWHPTEDEALEAGLAMLERGRK